MQYCSKGPNLFIVEDCGYANLMDTIHESMTAS